MELGAAADTETLFGCLGNHTVEHCVRNITLNQHIVIADGVGNDIPLLQVANGNLLSVFNRGVNHTFIILVKDQRTIEILVGDTSGNL